MGILKTSSEKKEKVESEALDKSIYVSDARIDRDGVAWKRKSIWFRQEHLGKLKALAHFQGKKTSQLIDEAVGEFVSRNWDNSMAMKKIVAQSMSRKKVKI